MGVEMRREGVCDKSGGGAGTEVMQYNTSGNTDWCACEGAKNDWCPHPQLGRGRKVVNKLNPEGLGATVEAGMAQMRQEYVAVTNGSEKRPKETYGWYMVGKNGDYCGAGKVLSHTREMDSYRAELHRLMSVMAGE